jgi:biotin carboxylase
MKTEEGWFIAVTSGRWQRHGIQQAKAIGLKVLAIDADPIALGFADADKTLCMSFADHSLIIQALHDLDLHFIGAVSFCSEVGMILAAKIRETFNLRGPRLALCERLLDKSVQRKIWREKKVPGPAQYKVLGSIDEALAAANDFELPFIIKPIDSSGSRGVTKIESADDVPGAVARAFNFSRSGKIIFETYMDGTEFTVEVFAIEGEVNVFAVTEKKKVEGTRGTVARELATPDRSTDIIEKIKNAVIAAFKALDYTDGPGHAEIILMKNNDVGMVEVAGRGGGFMVFDKLVPKASGINIARLTVLQAVGLPVEKISIQQNGVVLRFFPSRPGKLEGIYGFEEANKIVGVEAAAFARVGNEFNNATVDEDRMGYILSKAATPQEAQKRADEAENKIFFDIKNIQ